MRNSAAERENNFNKFDKMTMLSTMQQVFLFITGWKIIEVIAEFVKYILVFAYNIPRDSTSLTKFFRSPGIGMGINGATYLILLAVLLLIVNKDIPKLLKSFKGWKPYVAGVVCFIAMLTFNNIWNIIVSTFYKIKDNVNEGSIVAIEKVYPLYSLIIFGFVGPICEELTYRVGLFSAIRKRSRWGAYAVVAIVFAFIHFNISGSDIINELLNLPTYMFAGIAFSFTYEYFGFAGSLTAHLINNVLALVLTRVI